MRRLVLLLTGWTLSAFLIVGCAASDSVSLEDVANAASETGKYRSVRIDMTMTIRVPGLPGAITTKASGAFDNRAQRGHMTVDMTDVRREAMAGVQGATKRVGGPAAWRGEQVIDFSGGRLVTYMRIPFMSRAMKTSKPWIKYDLQKLGEQAGLDLQQFMQVGGSNPAQAVDLLRALSGKVETKGSENVRGVETTRHHVTIDLEKYPSIVPPSRREEMRKTIDRLIELTGVRTVPSDVWIGDDQVIRKMHYLYEMRVLDERTGQRQPREMDVTMELYDFDTTVSVKLPPPEQVFDLSELIGST